MALFPTDSHARYIVQHRGMKDAMGSTETAIVIHLPFGNPFLEAQRQMEVGGLLGAHTSNTGKTDAVWAREAR